MGRPRKYPIVNPQTIETPAEPKQHADPTILNPVKTPPKRVERIARPGWCKFLSKGRCYVEGALLEDAEQEISLSPAGSYRQRNNRNLTLTEGTIPTMAEDAPIRPNKNASIADRREFNEYEVSFVDSLEDGDPRVGPAPVGVRLIKQG